MQIGKEEVKLFLFARGIISYIAFTKESIQKVIRANKLQDIGSVYKNKLCFFTLTINNTIMKLRHKLYVQ